MTEYTILHPENMAFNHNCEPNLCMYAPVAKVQASSLSEAFKKSQHIEGVVYKENVRSTSVGDIIIENQKPFLVKGDGFQEVDESWLTYIDWEYVEEVKNQFK